MKVEVFDHQYQPAGSVELNDELFAIEPREDILSRVVRWQLAKRRAGTHQTRTISMVSGSGKKIVRQKGTGGARHGAKRATQFRGGGIVFGPVVRDHGYSLPKKVRRLGLRMAIADKLRSNELVVLADLDLPSQKMRDFVPAFEGKGIRSALFVDGSVGENALQAIRNYRGFDVLPQMGLNVYDILRKEHLLLTQSALTMLEARL